MEIMIFYIAQSGGYLPIQSELGILYQGCSIAFLPLSHDNDGRLCMFLANLQKLIHETVSCSNCGFGISPPATLLGERP